MDRSAPAACATAIVSPCSPNGAAWLSLPGIAIPRKQRLRSTTTAGQNELDAVRHHHRARASDRCPIVKSVLREMGLQIGKYPGRKLMPVLQRQTNRGKKQDSDPQKPGVAPGAQRRCKGKPNQNRQQEHRNRQEKRLHELAEEMNKQRMPPGGLQRRRQLGDGVRLALEPMHRPKNKDPGQQIERRADRHHARTFSQQPDGARKHHQHTQPPDLPHRPGQVIRDRCKLVLALPGHSQPAARARRRKGITQCRKCRPCRT